MPPICGGVSPEEEVSSQRGSVRTEVEWTCVLVREAAEHVPDLEGRFPIKESLSRRSHLGMANAWTMCGHLPPLLPPMVVITGASWCPAEPRSHLRTLSEPPC